MNKGIATLVSTAAKGGRTRLTRVSHKAPARLLPMRSPRAEEAGAAVCALGSFGGGLLGGDHVVVDVTVEAGIRITLTHLWMRYVWMQSLTGFFLTSLMTSQGRRSH